MIELNKQHPDFNMTREVMALIPKLPAKVAIGGIASDLGIPGESVLHHIRIIQKKHRVSFMPGTDDMCVGSPCLSWPEIDKVASAYHERVYG